MKRTREEKAITLIALIITVVVLLILAVVAITSIQNDGIIEHANNAVKGYGDKQKQEQDMLGDYENYINMAIVESVESLQEKYEFTYYSTLSGAVTAVNNNSIQTENGITKDNAVAGVYTDGTGNTTVVLLKDTTLTSAIKPSRNMTINLGGHVATFNCAMGISGVLNDTDRDTITIDGRLEGSSIVVNGANKGTRLLQTSSHTFVINGGTYIAKTVTQTTAESFSAYSVYVSNNGGKLEANNAKFKVEMSLTSADTVTTASIVACSIGCYGEVELNSCDLKSYSNYSHKFYSTIGIHNTGILSINNCTVSGIHSGVSNYGKLYVNGGTYESFGHGGFYLCDGANGDEAYIQNATIRECDMPDGYTNINETDNNAGFYIGATTAYDGILVHMDNCNVQASKQPIVLKGTEDTANCTLYISNSTINNSSESNKKIRIDRSAYKIYIGRGCNFDITNVFIPEGMEQFDLTTSVFATDATYKRP